MPPQCPASRTPRRAQPDRGSLGRPILDDPHSEPVQGPVTDLERGHAPAARVGPYRTAVAKGGTRRRRPSRTDTSFRVSTCSSKAPAASPGATRPGSAGWSSSDATSTAPPSKPAYAAVSRAHGKPHRQPPHHRSDTDHTLLVDRPRRRGEHRHRRTARAVGRRRLPVRPHRRHRHGRRDHRHRDATPRTRGTRRGVVAGRPPPRRRRSRRDRRLISYGRRLRPARPARLALPTRERQLRCAIVSWAFSSAIFRRTTTAVKRAANPAKGGLLRSRDRGPVPRRVIAVRAGRG